MKRIASLSLMTLGAALCAAPALAQPLAEGTVAWEAPATTIIDAEERTFRNGDVTLSGTLYTPRGGTNMPLVIALHGAQAPLRDTPLYRHLPRMLAPMGVAVLLFDRRGSGRSGGRLVDADYAGLADDGIAAQRALAADPRIDRRRIGFWGLSQGGWITLLAAQRSPDAAFAISVSAPLTQSEPQMLFAIESSLRIRGLPQADIDAALNARRVLAAYYRGETGRAEAQAVLDGVVDRPWFDLTYLPRALTDPSTSRWAREQANDPLANVRRVRIPTLVLFGARDPWIPVATSVERIRDVAARQSNIEWAVVADADHTMSTGNAPSAQIDPHLMHDDQPEAVEYFARVASWLTRQGMVGSRR